MVAVVPNYTEEQDEYNKLFNLPVSYPALWQLYNIAHTWYSVGGEIKLLSLISITLSLQRESGQKHTTPASWLRLRYAAEPFPFFTSATSFILLNLDDTAWFLGCIVYAQNKSYRTQ